MICTCLGDLRRLLLRFVDQTSPVGTHCSAGSAGWTLSRSVDYGRTLGEDGGIRNGRRTSRTAGQGLSPNAPTTAGKTTALMMVAGDPAKLRLLLDRGADVNARAASGFTALMVAAQYGGSADTSACCSTGPRAGDRRWATITFVPAGAGRPRRQRANSRAAASRRRSCGRRVRSLREVCRTD